MTHSSASLPSPRIPARNRSSLGSASRTLLVLVACTLSLLALSQESRIDAQWGNPREVIPASDVGAFSPIASAAIRVQLGEVERLLLEVEANRRGQGAVNDSSYAMNRAHEQFMEIIDSAKLAHTSINLKDLDDRWQGGERAVMEMLWRIPEVTRMEFIERCELSAEIELENALRVRDLDALRSVANRFSYTRAGQKAAHRLASTAIDEGRYALAVFALERCWESLRLFGERATIGERAQCVMLLARAYRLAGRKQRIQDLAVSAGSLLGASVIVGEEKRTVASYLSQQQDLAIDAMDQPANPLVEAWPMGSLSGRVTPDGMSGFPDPAWSADLPISETPPYSSRYSLYGNPAFMFYYDDKKPELPPVMPVVYQSTVLANTGEHLVAYNLHSGQRQWVVNPFPPHHDSYDLLEQDSNLILTVSAWQGIAFAGLENPQRYSIDDPRPDREYGLNQIYPVVRRALTAVRIDSGEQLWTLGGNYRLSQDQRRLPELERQALVTSFFHSIVVDGVLYAIGATRDNQCDFFLFAIDPHKGTPLWYLPLAQAQVENTMFGGAAREPLPAIPVYGNGLLFLVSNQGGVIAVDPESRAVRWVTRYTAIPRPYTRQRITRYRKTTFGNDAPILSRDSNGRTLLVIAPCDSCHITALDAESGERVWEQEVEPAQRFAPPEADRNDAPTALIGINGGRVWYGYGDKLMACDIDTGRLDAEASVRVRHNRNLLMIAKFSGRPLLTATQIFWPCAYGVAELPLPASGSQGVLTGELSTTSNPAGNLSMFHSVLVNSMGRYHTRNSEHPLNDFPVIEVRFDSGAMLERARVDVEARPDDAMALLRYALLASKASGPGVPGDLEIESMLQRALALAEGQPEAVAAAVVARKELFDRLLREADMAQLKGDAPAALGCLDRSDRFAADGAQRYEVFRRREHLASMSRETSDKIAFYTRWANVESDFTVPSPFGGLPIDVYARMQRMVLSMQASGIEPLDDAQFLMEYCAADPALVALYRVAASTVSDRLRVLGVEGYAEVEVRAARRADAIDLDDTTSAVLRAFLRAFQHSDSARDVLGRILDRMEAGDSAGRLESVVRPTLDEMPLDERSEKLWVRVAEVQLRADMALGAYLSLRKVLTARGDLQVSWLGKQNLISDILKSEAFSALTQQSSHFDAHPLLPLQQEPAWTLNYSETTGETPLLARQAPIGEEELVIVRVLRRRNGLSALSICTGEEKWFTTEDQVLKGFNESVRFGDNLVFFGSQAAIAVDRLSGEVRWQLEYGSRNMGVSPMILAGMAIVVIDEGRSNSLYAFDPESGTEAWTCPTNFTRIMRLVPGSTSLFATGITPVALPDNPNAKRQQWALLRVDYGTGQVARQTIFESTIGSVQQLVYLRDQALAMQQSYVGRPGVQGALVMLNPETLEVIATHESRIGTTDLFPLTDGLAQVESTGRIVVRHPRDGSILREVAAPERFSVMQASAVGSHVVVVGVEQVKELGNSRYSLYSADCASAGAYGGVTVLSDIQPQTSTAVRSFAFPDGVAVTLARSRVVADPNTGQRRSVADPVQLVVVNPSSPSMSWQRELPSEDGDRSIPDCMVHASGLVLRLETTLYAFLPERLKR